MTNPGKTRKTLWGAAFLMATSAIGPGFLTQTSFFTSQLLASFGSIILLSILIDIGVQLNIWRLISGYEKPAQEIANGLLPGLGWLLSAMVFAGGLAFNIGNIAGAGLGLQVITGMDIRFAALLSGLFSIWLLVAKNATALMDRFVLWMGFLMIGLTAWVAIVSAPPMGQVLQRSFVPDKFSWQALITIVGGTVGGYICFAGAHRLLDRKDAVSLQPRDVSRSAIGGILAASAMRILLFLAALGVVSQGLALDAGNPAADVFRLAAGEAGYRLFGIVMWCAAITSVIGSAYTSVSFISTYHPRLAEKPGPVLALFIAFSTIVFLLVGQPVRVLVWAGMLNGLILPFSLFILLAAVYMKKAPNGYQHPKWLGLTGLLIALVLAWIAMQAFLQ